MRNEIFQNRISFRCAFLCMKLIYVPEVPTKLEISYNAMFCILR